MSRPASYFIDHTDVLFQGSVQNNNIKVGPSLICIVVPYVPL